MIRQNFKTIKKIIEEFFQKTTFEVEINEISEKDGTIFIDLKTQEPQVLIGEGGRTLAEIQHLLKVILKRKMFNEKTEKEREPFYLSLDINKYKEKKYEYLRELARLTADDVSLAKKEKRLLPMLAHERRIIHLELADRPDVETESLGREPERRVLIRPSGN